MELLIFILGLFLFVAGIWQGIIKGSEHEETYRKTIRNMIVFDPSMKSEYAAKESAEKQYKENYPNDKILAIAALPIKLGTEV